MSEGTCVPHGSHEQDTCTPCQHWHQISQGGRKQTIISSLYSIRTIMKTCQGSCRDEAISTQYIVHCWPQTIFTRAQMVYCWFEFLLYWTPPYIPLLNLNCISLLYIDDVEHWVTSTVISTLVYNEWWWQGTIQQPNGWIAIRIITKYFSEAVKHFTDKQLITLLMMITQEMEHFQWTSQFPDKSPHQWLGTRLW